MRPGSQQSFAERSSCRNEAAGFCRARKPRELRVMLSAAQVQRDLTSGHARLALLVCADHGRGRENAINNGRKICFVPEAGSLHESSAIGSHEPPVVAPPEPGLLGAALRTQRIGATQDPHGQRRKILRCADSFIAIDSMSILTSRDV
jgi:hypothetical protein